MYIPKHFEVTDQEANTFVQLMSNTGGRLFSTHMPFLLSEDKRKIIGHLALQNPQHSGLEGQEILITLQGAHDYVSPSRYAAQGVPTWNYQSVHIYGRARIFKSTEKLLKEIGSPELAASMERNVLQQAV